MAELATQKYPVSLHRNTLGVLRYRLGDFEGCLDDLALSMELKSGGNARDLFFTAMAHKQLGSEESARSFFERAIRWTLGNMNRDNQEELIALRREAVELLGIEGY